MDLSFYPLTMEAVDQADAEALCLFIGADERPLTGLAGLADWRLCGRLSRMIRAGMVTGSGGEALLTPPGTRLSFKKLFVFGLGDARSEDELAGRVSEALRRLSQAGVRDAALQLPAKLAPERGVRTLMEGDGALARALVFASEPEPKFTCNLSRDLVLDREDVRYISAELVAPQLVPARDINEFGADN